MSENDKVPEDNEEAQNDENLFEEYLDGPPLSEQPDEPSPGYALMAVSEKLPESYIDALRESLAGLGPAEIEWVIMRSQSDSDAECARRLEVRQSNPLGYGAYPKERIRALRNIAYAMRKERAVAAAALIEGKVMTAISVVGELLVDPKVPPKVRLDAAREIMDRFMGRSGVKDVPAETIQAVAHLVQVLQQGLPTAEEIDAQHRHLPADYKHDDDDALEGDYDVVSPTGPSGTTPTQGTKPTD